MTSSAWYRSSPDIWHYEPCGVRGDGFVISDAFGWQAYHSKVIGARRYIGWFWRLASAQRAVETECVR